MKRLVLTFALAALVAGCASQYDTRSAARVVIPANTTLGQTSWKPAEWEIADLELKLGELFVNPDVRITGLEGAIPPYPLSDYVIRYTVAGPSDAPYVLGEAVHQSRPEATAQLDPSQPGYDMKTKTGPFYFTVLFDAKFKRVREVHFNGR